jgi:PAS domain-containing protein
VLALLPGALLLFWACCCFGPCWRSGLDARCDYCNATWLAFTGRPLDREFVHPDDQRATLLARDGLKANQPLIGLANRYRCKDGSYCWFEWRSVGHPERDCERLLRWHRALTQTPRELKNRVRIRTALSAGRRPGLERRTDD